MTTTLTKDDPGASEKPSLLIRLRDAMVKPPKPGSETEVKPAGEPQSVEELEAASKSATDKERAIGLIAAPFAALIGILVIAALISHNPPALLKNGQVNKAHANPSLYLDLGVVLLGMSVLMIVMALWRKRLFLGIVLALYGLAIFNLHYWGFGIPFLLFGSWYLVRAYRMQKAVTLARSEEPLPGANGSPRASANKRYTPSSSTTKRSSTKPKNQPAG